MPIFPTAPRRGVAALTGLALLLAATSATAQTAALPRLKAFVSVEGDVVRLADLLEGAGTDAMKPMFRAPDPGQSGTILASRVALAARDIGLAGIDIAGLATITVKRNARKIGAEEMAAAIRKALVERHGLGADSELELTGGAADLLVEPTLGGDLQVRNLSFVSGTGRFEATLALAGSAVLDRQPPKIAGMVTDFIRVPVLAKAVLKGDVVVANDFTLERRRHTDLQEGVITDPDKLIGHAARRPLRQGQTVRDSDIARPELVERNGTVTMVVEMPGIVLTLRGRALGAGAKGDTIQVQNLQSKKIVDALVIAAGRVAVAPPGQMLKTARAAE